MWGLGSILVSWKICGRDPGQRRGGGAQRQPSLLGVLCYGLLLGTGHRAACLNSRPASGCVTKGGSFQFSEPEFLHGEVEVKRLPQGVSVRIKWVMAVTMDGAQEKR